MIFLFVTEHKISRITDGYVASVVGRATSLAAPTLLTIAVALFLLTFAVLLELYLPASRTAPSSLALRFGILLCGLFTFIGLRPLTRGWLLKLYMAVKIEKTEAEELHAAIDKLHRRAGILTRPELYILPSKIRTCFVLGTQRNPAIVLSTALLQSLNSGEIAALLAHEVAHIKQRDLVLFGQADFSMRLANIIAVLGQLALLLNLPLYLLGLSPMLLWPWLLAIFAPQQAALVQNLFSKKRELEADKMALHLCGDVAALRSAIVKSAAPRTTVWQRILLPGWCLPQAALLRAHPSVRSRLEHLQSLITAFESDDSSGSFQSSKEHQCRPASSTTDVGNQSAIESVSPKIAKLIKRLECTSSKPALRVSGLWF